MSYFYYSLFHFLYEVMISEGCLNCPSFVSSHLILLFLKVSYGGCSWCYCIAAALTLHVASLSFAPSYVQHFIAGSNH